MASEEELFISINPSTYRENKSNILKSQANLLQSLKRLHNLQVITRQKKDFKERLNKLLLTTISKIDLIQNKMPTPKIPRTIKKYEIQEGKSKELFSKRNDIEEELKLIQEKLKELNS